MNNSLKGALLSGLAFPGVGQIFLKRYKRGIALIITASVSLLVFVVKAMQHAHTILENTGKSICVRFRTQPPKPPPLLKAFYSSFFFY
jgi:hypothetical protein